MPIWSKEETKIVLENYGKIDTKNIVKLLPDKTIKQIRRKANHLGLKCNYEISQPRTKVDDNFFTIPNPVNSYWAGFIAADGCISKNGRFFSVNQSQLEPLQKLKDSCKYQGNISYQRKLQEKIMDRHYPAKEVDIYTIKIKSKQMVLDLYNNFNITSQKSYTLQPPKDLNEYNTWCFIAGLIDGDGHIGLYLDKRSITPKIQINIVGTIYIIKWVSDFFGNFGHIYHPIKKHHPVTAKYHCSCNNAKYIINKIKSITEIQYLLMNRKWSKIENIKPIRKRKNRKAV